jgi:putative FmdB family regulatory protein
MPIYDYKCSKCKKNFSVQMTVEKYNKNPKATCPKCKSTKVERVFSGVSVITSKKS